MSIVKIQPANLIPANGLLKPIPQEVNVKEEFVERYQALLGSEYDLFMQHSLSYARKSIRVNTLKVSVESVRERLGREWILEPVPWCPEAFYIRYRQGDRFDLGNLPEHQLGYLYVQDAASMIPPIVLKPQPGELVLDLCAAPGSKTTQMAAMMQNTGVIVANDVAGLRLKPLGLNLQRMGVLNVVVTLNANRKFAPVFDRVLVDAPCSATGTIRRSLMALQMWSPGFVKHMVRLQRQVLEHGWKALKPGGVLVYSTCSLEPEEDEGNVSWFLEQHADVALEEISLPINRAPPIMEFDGVQFNSEVEKCLRIWPHQNDTEGFFVAKLRKLAQ